jgi:hypothetical protein
MFPTLFNKSDLNSLFCNFAWQSGFSCLKIDALAIGKDANLEQIESKCFPCYELDTFCIPKNVNHVKGSSLPMSEIRSILFEDGNSHFTSDNASVINTPYWALQYIGRSHPCVRKATAALCE